MTQTQKQTDNMPTRILHAMLRVGDLERSLEFYCNILGMKELRREDYPEGKFTLSFIGYGDEDQNTVLELTYNYGEKNYTHGSGFGHIALAVTDIYAASKRLEDMGVKILRQPGPMTHTADTGQRDVIAFAEDPDGYRVELIEVT